MSREPRRVPADWKHPRDEQGRKRPLHDHFATALEDWERERASFSEPPPATFDEWYGKRPDPADYMPDWPEAERTHWQMYETTSEGTPISPVMATPEELARWLADNGASAFADQTASYEAWLHTIRSGWAVSAVFEAGRPEGMVSGVEAFHRIDSEKT